MNKIILIVCLLLTSITSINSHHTGLTVLTSPNLNQKLPGTKPEPFGLGILGMYHYLHCSIYFSSDRDDVWWMSCWGQKNPIYISRTKNDRGTSPTITQFYIPTQEGCFEIPQDEYAVNLERVLDIAGIKPGMHIGEIGAGMGDLTFLMAKRVESSGVVIANDINSGALKFIADKKIPNIRTVLGSVDDPCFPFHDLDLIIMKHVFHDLENPLALLEHARDYLRPEGSLIIVENLTEGNADPNAFHDLTRSQILAIIKQSGFNLMRSDSIPSIIRPWLVLQLSASLRSSKDIWVTWLGEFKAQVEDIQRKETENKLSPSRACIAWERVLNNYRDDAPGTEEDNKLRVWIYNRIQNYKHSKRSLSGLLRPHYLTLSDEAFEPMLQHLGFNPSFRVRKGDFVNQYEALQIGMDNIVVDHATNLVWYPSGSEKPLDYFAAQEWIEELNERSYAGRSDWRMPTTEELLSLMETAATSRKALIDLMFSDVQIMIWTGDESYPGRNWVINFGKTAETIRENLKVRPCWVRPVASEYNESKLIE